MIRRLECASETYFHINWHDCGVFLFCVRVVVCVCVALKKYVHCTVCGVRAWLYTYHMYDQHCFINSFFLLLVSCQASLLVLIRINNIISMQKPRCGILPLFHRVGYFVEAHSRWLHLILSFFMLLSSVPCWSRHPLFAFNSFFQFVLKSLCELVISTIRLNL